MPSPAGDTGERPILRRRRFVWWDWDDLAPMIARLATLMLVAYFAGNTQSGEVADALLEAQENAASTQEVRAVKHAERADNAARLDVEYESFEELARFHTIRGAECDAALEVFERHFEDRHEWAHVLEACHSETPLHAHPTDEPTAEEHQ